MKTIVWDVDDVLNDLMRDWFSNGWLPSHPNCAVTYDNLSENPPHRVIGIGLGEYLASLDDFRLAQGARLQPLPNVHHWFQVYGRHFRHITLSAVPLGTADISAAWVLKYYGQWIRSFNVIPSSREQENALVYDRTKKDFLQWWCKADIIVDDNSVTIAAAQELGIKTMLIPRPWNKSQKTVSDILKDLARLSSE